MSQGSAYGIPIDTDGTLSANSDQLVPSQKAIKTYVDTEIAGLPTPVESVTDDGNGVVTVDNTDPANPVIGYNGGAAGDGGNVISAGGVTAASTGTVVFSNANSVSFGMAGNTVTASFSAPSGGNLSFSAGTQSSTVNALTFSNSNGVSFGLNNGTVTASHNGLTVQSVQTQNMVSVLGSTGDISFANSNGITFGGNASTITASHNGITSQSVQPVAVSGSNGSFSFSTVTFGNLNGISFYTSNNSLVGSYTVPTVTNSSLTASAGTQSATVSQLVFSNSNGVSFGLNNGTITGSHNGLTAQSSQPILFSASGNTFSNTTASGYDFVLSGLGDAYIGLSGNTLIWSHPKETHNVTAPNGSFTYSNEWGAFNSNGVSFSTTVSGATSGLIASHNGITSQSVQTQNAVSILGSTGNISFANSNGITFGGNASTITASHNGLTSQSNQALSGSNGSFTFQTATLGNLNGVSFYTSNGSLVASHNGLTSQSNQAVSGSNGSFTFQTVTFGNLNGMSFYTSNGSLVASYTVPAAGGALSFSAGTTSNTLNSLVFSNLNGVSFGLNGSTVTASVNAGGGSDITLSMWPDRINAPSMLGTQYSGSTGNTGGSTQQTASYFVASIQLQHPVVFDNVFGNIVVSATSAGTGSATAGHCIGLYSLDANTALSLVSSWQWQMYVSQNSVTARSHKWFWGTDPTANSSGLSGNVSASFTSPSNAGRRFLMSNGLNTLTEGNYYLVSAYTARSAGANVYNAGTQAALDGIGAAVAATMVGEANISRLVGFNGLFSSTTNVSTLGVAIMPSSIHTSAITVSATNASGTHRTPFIIFERSQS